MYDIGYMMYVNPYIIYPISYIIYDSSFFPEVQGVYYVVMVAGLAHEHIDGEHLSIGFVGAGTVAQPVRCAPIHKLKAVWRIFTKE